MEETGCVLSSKSLPPTHRACPATFIGIEVQIIHLQARDSICLLALLEEQTMRHTGPPTRLRCKQIEATNQPGRAQIKVTMQSGRPADVREELLSLSGSARTELTRRCLMIMVMEVLLVGVAVMMMMMVVLVVLVLVMIIMMGASNETTTSRFCSA